MAAGAGVLGATSAAGTQAKAANNATAAQEAMFNQTQANVAPYIATGDVANQQLQNLLAPTTATGSAGDPNAVGGTTPNAAETALQNTPGYQFTQQQGNQAVTNSLAAQGLGGASGPLGKGLARFVTGLADQTYNSQVANYQNATNTGAQAALGQGNIAAQTGSNVANTITGAGNASAAGTIGSTNAITGALQSATSGLLTNRLLGIYAPTTTPAATVGTTSSFLT